MRCFFVGDRQRGGQKERFESGGETRTARIERRQTKSCQAARVSSRFGWTTSLVAVPHFRLIFNELLNTERAYVESLSKCIQVSVDACFDYTHRTLVTMCSITWATCVNISMKYRKLFGTKNPFCFSTSKRFIISTRSKSTARHVYGIDVRFSVVYFSRISNDTQAVRKMSATVSSLG